ncbi:HAD family phosphatase [Streptomyces antarcticus]|uniref:HAD family phosphatase n=1 Tax=Streptomyces antarcticus TaxID=2996458 RepID=UPI00226DA61E|nr:MULTISPECIES: HAD family phosphatase [unclassified Streptomyces]MCY0945927.1 HAD family phosphatase [Streptomyces sp. H34-AA3]MCZ4083260.1 HAD family phosphatase [Streptomyces sp. H34-S5]
MQPLRQLRLAALNIDGVLLNDTFSPVIHGFVTSRGGSYDGEVERGIFSQPRAVAALAMGRAAGVDWPADKVLEVYFEERAAHLERHPLHVLPGVGELLHRLRRLGLRTVCYGGLDKGHFDHYLGHLAHLFDGPGYVSTDSFRPGVHEIAVDVFGLDHAQALFVDDVARVAEAALGLGASFIGHPSPFEHGFQEQQMREAGVRHLVGSLDEIDEELLRAVDAEAAGAADAAGVAGAEHGARCEDIWVNW